MSEIALTVLKVLFLALLWLFIFSAVSVIRTDLFGKPVPAPDQPRRPRAGVTAPAAAAAGGPAVSPGS